MPDTSTGELCRLVITGPTSQVDLSVPVHVPLADLLPALLHALGPDLADRGLEHSGWVLQRLGETPLDEDQTVDELGLADGQHLHLRPRSEQIPPLDFDDLIDGIATGLSTRSGLWRPAWTRTAALVTSVATMLVGAATLWFEGGSLARAAFGVVAAVAFLSGAWVAEHRVKDRAVAVVLAGGAVLFGVDGAIGLSGFLELADRTGPAVTMFVAATMLVVTGMAANLIIRPRRITPWVTLLLVTTVLTLVTGVLVLLTNLKYVQIATLGLLLAAAVRPYVPNLGFRLCRLRLPELPVVPEDLQKDIDPEPGAEVVDGAATADQLMTALYVGIGLPSAVALVLLAAEPGWLGPCAAAVASIPPLLALRVMTSAWHRLALAVPSVIGIGAIAICAAADANTLGRLLLVTALAAGAATLATLAHTLQLRRLTPVWGRAGDILHVLALAALVPLAIGVLGYYALIRSMVG
ncbi:type VII secretion integral membrane protein EccD [Kineosporia succinea]|uniref:Type VII secretion integral membrane protein EccD n=1 Tax=Kineosporia succinea TaxID=84632 RepID=A0ABT9P502_9ACTN|nr:type VII secretion integral membrane protein EccD [Kineosporia succinea]MDP9827770.1 type VII secretion integral membrane protein EccD [Kineosporia succinea]